MCGRAAQTHSAVRAAAASLLITPTRTIAAAANSSTNTSTSAAVETGSASDEAAEASSGKLFATEQKEEERADPSQVGDEESRDNYNMSPGMDAVVFWMDRDEPASLSTEGNNNNNNNRLKMSRMTWGLVPRRGSAAAPLPHGMSKHFANLMFNARTDTLYEKPTFAALANAGKSCLIAVDGFFEWKAELGGKTKQPYFVHRTNSSSSISSSNKNSKTNADEGTTTTTTSNSPCCSYLLLAGLWTSVATGWPDQPMLDTFTVLTTDACEALQWLHTRMPVMVWDERLASAWLERPSAAVLRQLELAAAPQHGRTGSSSSLLQWHAVTPEMSSLKFRTADAVKALPKLKTVKSFFAAAGRCSSNDSSAAKNKSSSASKSQPSETKKQNEAESLSLKPETTTTGKRKALETAPEGLIQKGSPSATKKGKSSKTAKSSPTRPIDSFFKPKSSATKK